MEGGEESVASGAEGSRPGKGTSGSQGWAVQLIRPKRICTTWAGRAALDRLLSCHQELPLLRWGHTPRTPARTKRTGASGAPVPEGLVCSGFPGLRSPWVSPCYTSRDPLFKMVLRVQFPPLLPQASSPKVQHPSSPHPEDPGLLSAMSSWG